MQPGDVRRIMRRTRQIEGWFSRDAAALIALLDEAQLMAGVRGNIFEIGVHHGRSAVILCGLARNEERLGVCDVFGEQTHNVSASGSGDRAIFEANIAAAAPGFTRLDVFAKPSDKLTAEEIGRPHRLFHIDGGHLCEEALADLRLGATVLHDQGAIIVDDPFRADWPGVTEAILDFLAERPDFRPMIVGFNKLVIVPTAAAGIYEQLICDARILWRYFDKHVFQMKQLPMAGRDMFIMLVPTWRQRPEVDRNVARLLSWLKILGSGLSRSRDLDFPSSRERKLRSNPGS
jgi:hypothetical protein